MRRRGTVVRTQMMAVIQTTLLIRVRDSCQPQPQSVPVGYSQPPRKITEPKTLQVIIEAYSVSWNIDQRMPEYSTKNPPEISDSATGMSNGARWSSLNIAVKKIRKARGWRRMNGR